VKKQAIILLLFIPFFNNVQLATATTYSFPEYYFYIDAPTTISYPEMKFSIISGGLPSNISCWQREIEGLNINVTLEWYDRPFAANERVENHYAIHVGETFAITTPVKIACQETYADGNLAAGGTVTNWVTYISEESGSFLDLNIIDQSGRLRNSTVYIQHRVNNSMPWTPIKTFNGSGLNILLPNGLYQVLAKDIDSSIAGEIIFELNSDISVNVELELVGFSSFKLLNSRGILEIEMLINNYVGVLTNVSIFGELYFEGKLFQVTNYVRLSEFSKTEDFMLTIGFPVFEWKTGNYTVIGHIYAGEVSIAEREARFSYETPPPSDEDRTWIIYALIIAIIGISIPTIIFIKQRYQDELEVDERVLERCNSCNTENMAPFVYCSDCGAKQ